MKKLLLLLTGLIIFTTTALEAKNIKIDIKTKLDEKVQVRKLKHGLKAYIKENTGHYNIVEVGEKYQIWIKNYKRSVSGNRIEYQVDIELRSNNLISSGKLLKWKRLGGSFVFKNFDEIKWDVEKSLIYQRLTKRYDRQDKYMQLAGYLTHFIVSSEIPGVGAVVNDSIDAMIDEIDVNIDKIDLYEGIMIGAELYTAMNQLIEHVEK